MTSRGNLPRRSRLQRAVLLAVGLAVLLTVRWLIPTTQGPRPGSGWAALVAMTDPTFTILATVEGIQLVIPNRLLMYPWPRDAPGILVPCPHQERIQPHADGCLQAVGSGIGLRIRLEEAPERLSQPSFITGASLTFIPDAKWTVSPRDSWLKGSRSTVVRRAPEHDLLGYDAYNTMPASSLQKAMGPAFLDRSRRSYTYVPKTNSIPTSITCTFDRPDDRIIDNTVCEAIYPFSPKNAAWPPYPDYRIEYTFPGKDFFKAAEFGEWLDARFRSLMRKPGGSDKPPL